MLMSPHQECFNNLARAPNLTGRGNRQTIFLSVCYEKLQCRQGEEAMAGYICTCFTYSQAEERSRFARSVTVNSPLTRRPFNHPKRLWLSGSAAVSGMVYPVQVTRYRVLTVDALDYVMQDDRILMES